MPTRPRAASYVVETYLAADARDRFASEAEGIRDAANAPEVGGRVRVVRSYMVPGDEMGFHVIEADDVETVARLAAMADVEVERIVEAIDLGPDRNVSSDAGATERRQEG